MPLTTYSEAAIRFIPIAQQLTNTVQQLTGTAAYLRNLHGKSDRKARTDAYDEIAGDPYVQDPDSIINDLKGKVIQALKAIHDDLMETATTKDGEAAEAVVLAPDGNSLTYQGRTFTLGSPSIASNSSAPDPSTAPRSQPPITATPAVAKPPVPGNGGAGNSSSRPHAQPHQSHQQAGAR